MVAPQFSTTNLKMVPIFQTNMHMQSLEGKRRLWKCPYYTFNPLALRMIQYKGMFKLFLRKHYEMKSTFDVCLKKQTSGGFYFD